MKTTKKRRTRRKDGGQWSVAGGRFFADTSHLTPDTCFSFVFFALFVVNFLFEETGMKRQWPLIYCVIALLCGAATAAAQTPETDKIIALQTEVRKLRLELVQQRIEFQQWKIAQLESDLKRVREEREKAEAEERAVQQAIAEARTDEQEEIVSPKTELIETSLKQAQARQAAGQHRETELQEKLAREQSVLQQLAARAKQMQGSD
jgi:hypothetical protein